MVDNYIDINVDLGEGFPNDVVLMPLISSCNIACGGHAGNVASMLKTVRLAKKHKVKIGAHPSFPDVENFGRLPMKISDTELFSSLLEQIRNLQNVLDSEGVVMHHIKPHGALYNMANTDKAIATTIVNVIKAFHTDVLLYAPSTSVIAHMAMQEGIPVVYEAFADRNYNADLSLVSRTKANALITERTHIFEHVFAIATTGKVTTVKGKAVALKADTFCIHGDNPEAVNLLKYLKLNLEEKGIYIKNTSCTS